MNVFELNGGMENDLLWGFSGGADYSTDQAYEGLRSARLVHNSAMWSNYGGQLEAGDELSFDGRAWYQPAGGGFLVTGRLKVYLYTSGVFTEIYSKSFSVALYTWIDISFTHTVAASGNYTYYFNFTMSNGSAYAYMYLDGLSMEVPDVITTQIKNALVADLGLINGTGVFVTTVAEVGLEPKRWDEAKSPGLYIASSAGEADTASLTAKKGMRSQDYELDLVLKGSNTPNADLDAFLDDIANAVEDVDSNINGINGVDSVVVSEWTAVHTDPGIAEGIYLRKVTVSVIYIYERGSA